MFRAIANQKIYAKCTGYNFTTILTVSNSLMGKISTTIAHQRRSELTKTTKTVTSQFGRRSTSAKSLDTRSYLRVQSLVSTRTWREICSITRTAVRCTVGSTWIPMRTGFDIDFLYYLLFICSFWKRTN